MSTAFWPTGNQNPFRGPVQNDDYYVDPKIRGKELYSQHYRKCEKRGYTEEQIRDSWQEKQHRAADRKAAAEEKQRRADAERLKKIKDRQTAAYASKRGGVVGPQERRI